MGFRKINNFMQDRLRRNWPQNRINQPGNVAIVFANYNTVELTSYLLFSIFRILGTERLSQIVAVDNNSTDGSGELLQKFAGLGMIDLIRNRKQYYHGPALNQGIRYLGAKERTGTSGKRTRYIWILDSDVIILRSDAIADAVKFLEKEDAGAIGQFQYDALPEGYAHISSLLIDPAKTWKRQIAPFDNTGAPAANFQQSLRANGIKIADFPYRSDHYLLHLARGTLKSIHQQEDKTNMYYPWAVNHSVHHYHGDPGGREIHERFLEFFNREVSELTPDNLVAACRKPGKICFPLPVQSRINPLPGA